MEGCRREEGKDETFRKKTLAKREEACVTASPAISILEFIRSFLFRHPGFMLEVRINHWVCFHVTCIVNIFKLWTIKWSWRQKWAERCTFREKLHAHRTFLYREFFCFMISLSSPVSTATLISGVFCALENDKATSFSSREDLQIVSYKC